MTKTARKFFRPTRAITSATIVALMLVVSGCAGGSGSTSNADGGADALPADATKEDYIEALADIEPVRLSMPETATEGSTLAMKSEYFKEAVEEWSDGKITIEIGYGGSFASAPEVEGALQDGRIQVGFYYPSMRPDGYPELSKMMSVSNQGTISPLVGLMEGVGATGEYAWSNEAILGEIEDAGIVPLIPAMSQSPTQGTVCASGPTTNLDELSGKQIRISNGPVRGQLEAMGATPVSVTTAELYESLQRGVTDCNTSSIYGSDVLGLFDLTKHFTTSEEISFVSTIGTLGVNQQTWDSLPVPARQLLYAKSDAFLEGYIRMMIQSDAEGLETLRDGGGEVSYWGDDVNAALKAHQDETMEALIDDGNEALVNGFADSIDQWSEAVNEMGYEDGGSLEDLPDWYVSEELDLEAYLQHYTEVVLAPHFPGIE